jgi:hypothetical protein
VEVVEKQKLSDEKWQANYKRGDAVLVDEKHYSLGSDSDEDADDGPIEKTQRWR